MFGKRNKVHPELSRKSESSLKNNHDRQHSRSRDQSAERPPTPTRHSHSSDEKRYSDYDSDHHDHRHSSNRARTPPHRDSARSSNVDDINTNFPIVKSEEEEQKRLDNYSTIAHRHYKPEEESSCSSSSNDHHDEGREHREHHRHHRHRHRRHSQPKKAERGNSESTLMEAIQHFQENKANHVFPQPQKVSIVKTERLQSMEATAGNTENASAACSAGCEDNNTTNPLTSSHNQQAANNNVTQSSEDQCQHPMSGQGQIPYAHLSLQQTENLEEERKRDLFHALCKIPFMPKFLEYNPAVRDDLLAHPDIGYMVAEDPHLARKVTIWPEIVLELIDGTYIPDIEDPEPENRLKKGDTSVSVARPHAILVATKDTETLPVNMVEHGIQPSRHIMAVKPKDPMSPLKHLASTGHLFLNHHLEVLHSVETGSKHKKRTYYEILDGSGHILYKAYEGDASKFSKAVSLVLKDSSGKDAILMKKHYDTCSKKMIVHCPPGRLIGSVVKVRRCKDASLAFQVQNSVGETLIIAKPRKTSSKQKPDFELRSHIDNTLLGKITGDWNDIPSGVADSKQVFGLRFPHDLHCNMKIVVMAAWFLIYKYFFEGAVKKQEHHTTQSGHSVKVPSVEDEDSSVSQVTQIHSIPTISEASEYDIIKSQYEEYEDKHEL